VVVHGGHQLRINPVIDGLGQALGLEIVVQEPRLIPDPDPAYRIDHFPGGTSQGAAARSQGQPLLLVTARLIRGEQERLQEGLSLGGQGGPSAANFGKHQAVEGHSIITEILAGQSTVSEDGVNFIKKGNIVSVAIGD